MADAARQIEDMSFEYVNTSSFSPVTSPWIKELAEALDGSPSGDKILRVETAALLFFILRALPDDEFPGGKWATIQHLESQIENVIQQGMTRDG